MFSFLLLAASWFCIACSEEDVWITYGSNYSFNLPRKADFLEFNPYNRDNRMILWNRTNPHTSGGRGQLMRNVWKMLNLTQADNGYYDFRRKGRTLISRKALTVEANYQSYERMVGEDFTIVFPLDTGLGTLTFTGWEAGKGHEEARVLMKAGILIGLYEDAGYLGRLQKLSSSVPTLGVKIQDLKRTDSGSYKVRDQHGNLALVVTLEVMEPVPLSLYIGVAVGIVFLVLICCCCVRKKCCRKSSSKRDTSVPQTAAAPAVYHDDTSQPSGPSFFAALYVPTYPASSSLAKSTKPEVAATGGEGAAPSVSLGSDCLSSDHEPQFKMKGLTSVDPLSSDTTFTHMYTSDKLNFL